MAQPLFDAVYYIGCFSLLLLATSIIVFLLPKKLAGQLPKPLRDLRAKLLGWWRHCKQLSTEGPFYRLTIWMGKSIFKGKLSSQCKAPEVRLKPTGNNELSVTITPNTPWNPFHVESYVVAWCPEGTKDWQEKSFITEHDLEKVGTKLKSFIDGLPHLTLLKVHCCATNAWGRSEWSKVASAETLATPSDDGGFTGPLGPACADKVQYTWTQTRTEVFLKIPVADEVRSKDIRFKCTGPKLEVKHVKGDAEPAEMLCGTLHKKVKVDEVFWTIEVADKKYGRHLSIQMVKAEALEKWSCLIEAEGHKKVDTRLIRFFTGDIENMSDLSGLARR